MIPDTVKRSRYKQYGKWDVYLVDGAKIRQYVEGRDFTAYGHRYQDPFIPENELWVDILTPKREVPYYVARLLYEVNLIEKGVPRKAARLSADSVEQFERSEKPIGTFIGTQPAKHDPVQFGKMKVVHVSAPAVRSRYDVRFSEGGHDLVFAFIPLNEIWLDDRLDKQEANYVLLHELVEHDYMSKGLSYAHAHERALIIEWSARASGLVSPALDKFKGA